MDTKSLSWDWRIAGLITVLALLVRAFYINVYPLHGNEGLLLNHLRGFALSGTYHYSPWYHGPLLHYVAVPILPHYEFHYISGRALIISITVLMVACSTLLVRHLDTIAGYTGAMALAVTPFVVGNNIMYRPDPLVVATIFMGVISYLEWRKSRTKLTAAATGLAIGLAWGTSEHSYVVLPPLLFPIIIGIAREWRATGSLSIGVDSQLPINTLGTAIVTLFGSAALIFAGWPLTVSGIVAVPSEILGGIRLWTTHSHGGAPSPTFYIYRLTETPALVILGIGGILTTAYRRKWSIGRQLFISWFIGELLIFSLVVTRIYPRFLLFIATPLAVCAGFAVSDVLYLVKIESFVANVYSRVDRRHVVMLILLISVVGVSPIASQAGSVDYIQPYYSPQSEEISHAVQLHAPSEEHSIYSQRGAFGAPPALSYRLYPYERMGVYNESQQCGLVLTKSPVPQQDSTSNVTVRGENWNLYVHNNVC